MLCDISGLRPQRGPQDCTVGFPFAPQNAVPLVKKSAKHALTRYGGDRAVREAANIILPMNGEGLEHR